MQTRSLFRFSSLLCLGFAASIAAHAAPNAASAGNNTVLAKFDADNDGTLSLDEVKQAAAQRFDALDKDHEATLDKSELAGLVKAGALKKADKDKDGTLDKDEFVALAAADFQKADKDKDGTLSAAELNSPGGRALAALLGT
jgi:Ca2+-binding EF-hand superfamily protein